MEKVAHAAKHDERAQPIWAVLSDRESLPIDDEDRHRIGVLVAHLHPLIHARGRRPIADLVVEFLAVTRSSIFPLNDRDQAVADQFVSLLRSRDVGAADLSVEDLERLLEKSFTETEPGGTPLVELMTVHKAKGLEFDCVLLPRLHRTPRSNTKPLVAATSAFQGGPLSTLIAPFSSIPARGPSLFEYLWSIEASEFNYETHRLLYVAMTRARESIHLFGVAGGDTDDEFQPASRSFLGLLWPRIRDEFVASLPTSNDREEETDADRNDDAEKYPHTAHGSVFAFGPNIVRCVPVDTATLSAGLAPDEVKERPPAVESQRPEFEWAGSLAREVGITVHALLEFIGRDGIENVSREEMEPRIKNALRDLSIHGISSKQFDEAQASVRTAIDNVFDDRKARWILSGQHREIRNEWRLFRARENISKGFQRGYATYVIDRTFVDHEGIRWIVDYKNALRRGGNLERFIDEEMNRYREQLETYAALVNRLEQRPIQLLLYFPFLKQSREWQAVI